MCSAVALPAVVWALLVLVQLPAGRGRSGHGHAPARCKRRWRCYCGGSWFSGTVATKAATSVGTWRLLRVVVVRLWLTHTWWPAVAVLAQRRSATTHGSTAGGNGSGTRRADSNVDDKAVAGGAGDSGKGGMPGAAAGAPTSTRGDSLAPLRSADSTGQPPIVPGWRSVAASPCNLMGVGQRDGILIVALTGGPCAGKSTALSFLSDQLSRRGCIVLTCVESATLGTRCHSRFHVRTCSGVWVLCTVQGVRGPSRASRPAVAVMSNGVKPPSGRESLKAFQKVMLETTLGLERTFLTWARLALTQSQPRMPW